MGAMKNGRAKSSAAGWGRLIWQSLACLLIGVIMVFLFLAIVGKPPNYILTNVGKGISQQVYMEIADTDFSRMRGLMFRERIIPILFIFGSEGHYPIHSNFVPAPFDAVYLSPDGTVVEIFRKIPPGKSLISPTAKASYLLELPPDVFDRLEIAEGDRISWEKMDRK